MLRSSQSLSLRSRLGLSTLHQPLPLSNRDAHKLLGILKTSFRNHLDAEHGAVAPSAGAQGSSEACGRQDVPHKSISSSPGLRRRPDSPQELHVADRHFQSLLTNPLFAGPPPIHLKNCWDSGTRFDMQVARGAMDCDKAATYLYSVQAEISKSSFKNIRDGMKHHEAGLRVLKWLLSSGLVNELQFFRNSSFTRVFMHFLVGEGLQDVAWTWAKIGFEQPYRGNSPEVYPNPQVSSIGRASKNDSRWPFLSLIQAEMRDRSGIDKACHWIRKASNHLDKRVSEERRHWLLGSSQKLVVDQFLQNHSALPSPSETAYEAFLDTLPERIPSYIGYEFRLAHLLLLHPTRSSAESALELISNWKQMSKQDAPRRKLSSNTLEYHRIVISLSLDLTKFLLEHDQVADADWVMQFLRDNFPKELGVDQKKALDEAAAEASSLEMLGALDLKLA